MASIKRFIKAIRDYYGEGQAGDIAFLKTQLLGLSAAPELLTQLEDLVGYAPESDLEALSQLPEGTLGHAYAQHMLKNGIHPLVISSDLQAEANQDPFALRYTATHDMFHILLGFDTSYAGEMGVAAFTAAQSYSKFFNAYMPVAKRLYPLIFWGQRKAILANFSQGEWMGQQAECLLLYRFEDNWARPIADIRAELGLVLKESVLTNKAVGHTPESQAQQTLAA
ncbi:MAG: Coq4 family protein [Thermosynechococcaceae cyanobacterium]